MVPETRYRVIFEWPRYEQALREAARRRGWTEEQIAAALARDRLCTIEVDDIEAQLDWHERFGWGDSGPLRSGGG
jgi:hypothetical protein